MRDTPEWLQWVLMVAGFIGAVVVLACLVVLIWLLADAVRGAVTLALRDRQEAS